MGKRCLSFALALTESLRIDGLSIAPQGNFCQERQKSPKTPVETHGFHPSFPRSTAQLALDFTARQNRRAETSLTCCMAAAPNPLSRLPVQNVEVCTPTFQSGAAAKREAGTIPDLHQNAVFKTKSKAFFVPKTTAQRRSRNHRFLAAFLSRLSFRWWKERRPSETGQAIPLAGTVGVHYSWFILIFSPLS